MKRTAIVLAAALLACTVQAAGTVQVSFVKPEEFSDIGHGSVDRERATKALEAHLKAMGKHLPDGQTLKLEVTNVDLAGELRFTRRADEVRVLRGRADWPRVDLKYTLTQGDRTLRAGEAHVSDMSYLQTHLGIHKGEELAYERRMLERWVQELVAAK